MFSTTPPLRGLRHRVAGLIVALLVAIATFGAAPMKAQASDASDASDAPVTASPDAATLPLPGFTGLGALFVRNNRLDQLGWTDAEITAFADGVRAALRDRNTALDETATQRVGTEMIRRVQALTPSASTTTPPPEAMDAKTLAAYLKSARKRFGLQQADSGLLYALRRPGRGTRPTPQDVVIVTLDGKRPDGETPVAALSGENLKARMSDLLPGLREGLQMMAVGGEALFVLPPSLSFGSGPWPAGVERGTPLVFVVTLHDVISSPETSPAPTTP